MDQVITLNMETIRENLDSMDMEKNEKHFNQKKGREDNTNRMDSHAIKWNQNKKSQNKLHAKHKVHGEGMGEKEQNKLHTKDKASTQITESSKSIFISTTQAAQKHNFKKTCQKDQIGFDRKYVALCMEYEW